MAKVDLFFSLFENQMKKLLYVGPIGGLEEHCLLLGRWPQPSILTAAWFTSSCFPDCFHVSWGDGLAVRVLREMSWRFQDTLITRHRCTLKMAFTDVCDSFSFIFKAVCLSGAERRPTVPQRGERARGCKFLDADELLNYFSTKQGLPLGDVQWVIPVSLWRIRFSSVMTVC